MLYHFEQSAPLAFREWIGIFANGIRMDLSFTGYILLLSGVFIALLFFTSKGTYLFFKYFTLILLVIFTLILAGDMELYRNWGYRIDATPLFYLKTPGEAFASIKIWLILVLLILSFLIILVSIKLYLKLVLKTPLLKGKWWMVPIFLFLSATMIIPIRGGFGVAPMNPGKVYFSHNVFSNHAALNGLWNMIYGMTMLESMSKRYPDYLSAEEADSFYNSLDIRNDKAPHILKTSRPNIIILMLESFTSKIIESLGGLEGVAPNLNKLTKQGLLFTNIYASGDRSDKGLVSILSGFPAQSTQSIILYPPKSVKLPTISEMLDSAGYNTFFYYGGDPDFANIRSYLYSAKFRNFTTLADFPNSQNFGKWGVPDQFVFQRLLTDLEEAKSPFFTLLFTLSSHEPFEFPEESAFQGSDEESRFLSSVQYTDRWLGWFFNEAEKKSWYDSTLFIVIADHGHRLPGGNKNYESKKYAIPLLFVGGALDTLGVVSQVGSQIDLARTLLYQLDIDANKFTFSRNLLSQSRKQFAYYTFNDGFGFVTDSCLFIWDHTGQAAIHDNCSEANKKNAFSYFRYYYDYFLKL